MMQILHLFFAFLSLLFLPSSWSFLSPLRINKHISSTSTTSLWNSYTNGSVEDKAVSTLEIVLFGIGDLRTTDHGGLYKALHSSSSSSLSSSKILPLFILDSKDTLRNMPMGSTHLIDNASILHANLLSLQHNLKSKFDLDLHVCIGKDDDSNDISKADGVMDCLRDVIKSVVITNDQLKEVIVHSCDLGHVDNQNLGYGPYGHLMNAIQDDNNSDDGYKMDVNGVDVEIQVQGWDCFLRQQPWDDVSSNQDETDTNTFPSLFTDYETKYNLKQEAGRKSVTDVYESTIPNKSKALILPSMRNIPSETEIINILCKALNIPDCDMMNKKLESEVNTGLYATHWGGMDIPSTMDEECILRAIDIFLGRSDNDTSDQNGDEALAEVLKWWSQNSEECKLTRNPRSLEHATMNWLMTGGEENGSNNVSTLEMSGGVKTKSLIEGELLTRFLAAPLLFGTVSPRYVWKQAEMVQQETQSPLDILAPILQPTVQRRKEAIQIAKSIMENREWHKLFAAKNILRNNKVNDKVGDGIGASYDYIRWHGFLCRFGTKSISNINTNVNTIPSTTSGRKDLTKEGIVLVHGFGASGSQWEKTMAELETCLGKGDDAVNQKIEALAPDLMGFGQSEKPSLTYTQYLWEGYAADCVKEIGLNNRGWTSFVIGGNSIGGYTAMGTAADDTTLSSESNRETVSALGSAGSGRCKGLVLMNSAGKILSSDEIDESEKTVAELTAMDLLGINSPPPRELAKFGGNGLLAYLRPQIQSICKNLYPTNPDAVDDNLCGGILRDSLDPGAINVMISGSKLPPPRTANELLGADYGSSKSKYGEISLSSRRMLEKTFDGPVLVAQGILDPLNDAKGRADLLGGLRSGVTVSRMDGGHCPHDELPGITADYISSWMKTNLLNEVGEESISTV